MKQAIISSFNRTGLRFGITEKKRAEIDGLTLEVLNAQHDVQSQQAIVTALTLKLNNLQALLTTAESGRTQALNNMNLVDQLVQSAKDLADNSEIAFNKMADADSETKTLGVEIRDLINKLIYSVEIINKLANLVITKKALNPLISDELVSMIGSAGNEANNAVAVTLVALKSTFASEAMNMESQAAITLENMQAAGLYQALTMRGQTQGTMVEAIPQKDGIKLQDKPSLPLVIQIKDAYEKAKATYADIHRATQLVTRQLNAATLNLNKAQIKLKSLQSGLAAANAAAQAA